MTPIISNPTKRRKLDSGAASPAKQENGDDFSAEFSAQASKWNLEQAYQKRSKKRKEDQKEGRLPIKTPSGGLEESRLRTYSDDGSASSAEPLREDTPLTDQSDVETETPKASSREEVITAKEELARCASLINESPEEHYGLLKNLTEVTSSRNAIVTRLGLATQLSVYKDIIPGYCIRAISEEESKAKVSKDVRKQRAFEQSLVRGYQAYVRDLKRISQLDTHTSKDAELLVEVAVSCICNLLENVPHFNFRGELLSVTMTKLSRKPSSSSFVKCHNALAKLFENDDGGNASFEAVSMLSKMIKGKAYRIHESVLNLFLHLRLLSEFSHKGSTTKVDKNDDTERLRKRSKKQREHRSKQERKVAKERKAIEKEMQEADAIVGHQETDHNQAKTLKLVFSTYFRTLKERIPGLTGAVLEGLVKYAHLVNQDFFGDLLEALRELVQDMNNISGDDDDGAEIAGDTTRDSTREKLLCIITAFGLLEGQEVSKSASSLGLDLSFFINQLYKSLHDLCMNLDLETNAGKQQHPSHQSQLSRINVSTTIVLLLRSLRATLIGENTRNVPPVRLAAFTKQLMTSSLQAPEKSCTAILEVLNDVLKAHRGKINALWNTEERRGDGAFNALHEDVEGSNPFAATAWEGELLTKHFCPQVREGVDSLYEVLKKT